MKLEEITLRGFRNYEDASVSFGSGVNLLLGDNGHGKTNLLEAVLYLASGRSFRTRKEAELIGFGKEFADFSAKVTAFDRTVELRAVLFSGRKKRQLFVNSVKKRTFSEFSGNLAAVLFSPGDLQILKSGASARRHLLDQALCQLFPAYEHALSEYTKLLEHKSRILKDRFAQPSLMELLPDFNERLCRFGAEIISRRAWYMERLCAYAPSFHRDFSGEKEALALRYQTVSTVKDPSADPETLYQQLRAHLTDHWQAELDSCQCLTGPHRDDFDAEINGISLKSFASQGQTRTAAISLKLAEREILREQTGEEPVLLLDDVLSELDGTRQDFLLNRLGGGQVFISCCETDRLTDLGETFLVENGSVRKQ
ncbi:MAG: DNA replication/repair protein RecF [Oscillospiraceae bacterium]|nr:DNA replication/repair protein RecF [Oscillospiraceae bacterium]